MSRRSNGRPTPSRGARVERRAQERAAREKPTPGRKRMAIPDAIKSPPGPAPETDPATTSTGDPE